MSRMRRSSMSSSGETTISVRVSISESVDAVPPMKLRASLGEYRLVAVGPLRRRLRGVRPEHAGRRVADVAEAAPVVAGRVLLPAGDRDVLPAAVAAAGRRDEHVVAAVRQQLHFGHGRVRAADDPDRRRSRFGCRMRQRQRGGMRKEWRRPRDPLVQQHQGGLELRVRREPLLQWVIEQQVRDRQQAHALVVGHVGPDDRHRLAARYPRRRVVDGLVHSELARARPSAASRCRFSHAASGSIINASADA